MVKHFQAQLESYGDGFDMVLTYLDHIVKRKCCNVQFVEITTTGSHLVKPDVVVITRKKECKQLVRALCNSIFRKQTMQVINLHGLQIIKPAMK